MCVHSVYVCIFVSVCCVYLILADGDTIYNQLLLHRYMERLVRPGKHMRTAAYINANSSM